MSKQPSDAAMKAALDWSGPKWGDLDAAAELARRFDAFAEAARKDEAERCAVFVDSLPESFHLPQWVAAMLRMRGAK